MPQMLVDVGGLQKMRTLLLDAALLHASNALALADQQLLPQESK